MKLTIPGPLRAAIACLAVLLLGLATACGGDKAQASSPAELAIQAPGRQSSFMALTYGHFEVEDGCLFLVVDAKLRYIPVFPRDITRWDGDTLVIGDHRIRLGQSVQSGGGEVPSASAIGVKPPTACPATTRAWMVSSNTVARSAGPAQLVYQAGDGRASFMEHVNGKFEIENGCLLLVTVPNTRYVPIFPRKITRWDGETLVMGGNRMELGQPVRAGGGGVDAVTAVGFKRPDVCPIKAPVWVVDASTHAR